jgi:dynein heavy chain 1
MHLLLIYLVNIFLQVFAPSNSSTAAAVTFITFVQDLKKKTKAWGPMIELCANGEKTLERFRYQFPEDWLYSDQLRGEWSAYNEILKRKNDSIQEQLGMDSSIAFCHFGSYTVIKLAFN